MKARVRKLRGPWVSLALVVFPLMVAACEPSGCNASSGRAIIGRFGSGFTSRSLREPKSIAGAVSTVASFGVVTGQLTPQEPVGVAPDGSFSVPLTGEGDQVLLFADGASANVRERFEGSGFIVLPTADGGGMARIPVSGAAVDTVDLGAISFDAASGLGVSSLDRDAQAAAFGMGFDRLQAYYRFDNVLRMARNLYVNDDPGSSQWVDAGSGLTSSYLLSSIRNEYSSPATVPHRVFSVGFDIKFPADHGFADVSSGSVVIEVYPPAVITIDQTANTYGPALPLRSNGGPDLGNGWTVMGSALGSGSYSLGLSIDDTSGIPGGSWIVKKDGADFALFDFSSLAPYDEAGHFLYFMPSVKASVETDGRVTRLDLEWYAYDEAAGRYERVADPALLDEWIRDYGFGIGRAGGSASPIEEISRSTTSVTSFAYRWYLGAPPAGSGGVEVEKVWVLYSIGSMSFGFSYDR